MAKQVIAEVVGGEEKLLEAATVGEVRAKFGDSVKNYATTVNYEPADDSYILSDRDVVTFAPQVKGA